MGWADRWEVTVPGAARVCSRCSCCVSSIRCFGSRLQYRAHTTDHDHLPPYSCCPNSSARGNHHREHLCPCQQYAQLQSDLSTPCVLSLTRYFWIWQMFFCIKNNLTVGLHLEDRTHGLCVATGYRSYCTIIKFCPAVKFWCALLSIMNIVLYQIEWN